jgi:outer membrane biosynthesis protein TonB
MLMPFSESKSKPSGSSSKTGMKKSAAHFNSSRPKVLRVGILQRGRIVEERIIRKRESITVGPSEKNHFIIVSSQLPSRFEMFEYKGGRYTLQFMGNMQGRFSIKGELKELKDAKEDGKTRKRGKVYGYPLDDSARGKIFVGDSAILFQFVAPPPIQPRPQLPVAVRGGLFRNIEWFILSMWIISFLLHAGFLTWLETADWPVVSKWEKYMQLQELISPAEASFEKKKVEEPEDGEGDAEKKDEGKKKKEKKKVVKKTPAPKKSEGPKRSAQEEARARADSRSELAAQLAQRGINKIIGSLAGDGEGALVDVLGQGDVGADQDALLSQVSGVGVATGDRGNLRGPAGGKGVGEAADIAQVRMKGGDATVKTGGAGTERTVKGLVKRKNAAAIEGTGALDSQDVNKIIGKKMGAIKGCYERSLRRNPGLKGKLVIRFTISGSGKVTAARAVQNDLNPEVADCVSQAFKRFRFPQPDGGSLTLESPFMFLPSS